MNKFRERHGDFIDDLEKTSYYLVYVVVIQLLKSVVEHRSNKSDKRIHLQKLENEIGKYAY